MDHLGGDGNRQGDVPEKDIKDISEKAVRLSVYVYIYIYVCMYVIYIYIYHKIYRDNAAWSVRCAIHSLPEKLQGPFLPNPGP